MFTIGEAVVDEEIAGERFACDLSRCKGACCTLAGGRGAPLLESELTELRRAFPSVRKYLPAESILTVAREGLFQEEDGKYFTACVNDRDCVFVYYEDDIARCSLEKAFQNGETSWRKPLSCHLFPVRVSDGGRLRYERIPECSAGRKRGQSHHVPLHEFVKEALIRKFGEIWYETFRKDCRLRGGLPHDGDTLSPTRGISKI